MVVTRLLPVVVLTASLAEAQEPARVDVPPPATTDAAPPVSALVVGGRVELRASSADDDAWSRQYAPRAILGVKFQHERIQGEAELGIATLPELRDAFVRAKVGRGVALQVGKFRPPFGRFEQTSRWDLPVVRRGALSAHGGDLGFTGRRSGLELRVRAKELPGRPQVQLGVFQGDPLSDGSRAEDIAGRAVFRVRQNVSVGVGGYARGVVKDGVSDRFLVAADVGVVRGLWDFAGEVQAGPQLQGAIISGGRRIDIDLAHRTWVQPALTGELVKAPGSTEFVPFIVPALAAGTGAMRGVVALELGAGREAPGSTRKVAFSAVVGAAF